MIQVKLERLENGTALRTDTVEGGCEVLPTEGRGFAMISSPINPLADGRLVMTSTVQEVELVTRGSSLGGPVYTFKTLNSTYKLTVQEAPAQ